MFRWVSRFVVPPVIPLVMHPENTRYFNGGRISRSCAVVRKFLVVVLGIAHQYIDLVGAPINQLQRLLSILPASRGDGDLKQRLGPYAPGATS